MELRKVERDLLRVEEVAARLGCNPETIRRKIRAGQLPGVRLGDGERAPFRIDRAELAAWLDTHRFPKETR